MTQGDSERDAARQLYAERCERHLKLLVGVMPASRLTTAVRLAFGDIARMCEQDTVNALMDLLEGMQRRPAGVLPLELADGGNYHIIRCVAEMPDKVDEPCVHAWRLRPGTEDTYEGNGKTLASALMHAAIRHREARS